MISFRRAWVLLIVIFSAYMLASLAFEVLLFQVRPWLERETARVLSAEKVSIRFFYNNPFWDVSAEDITVRYDSNTYLTCGTLRVQYNLFSFLLGGPAALVSRIELDQVSAKASLGRSLEIGGRILSNFSSSITNTNLYLVRQTPHISMDIGVRDISVAMDIFSTMRADAVSSNMVIMVRDNQVSLSSLFNMSVVFTNDMTNMTDIRGVRYLDAAMDLSLLLKDPSGVLTGSCRASLERVRLGGVKLIEDEEFQFDISNRSILNVRGLTNNPGMVTVKGDTVRVLIERDLVINCRQNDEYDLFEHIFSNGLYRAVLRSDISPDTFFFESSIKSDKKPGSNSLELSGGRTGSGFSLYGTLLSEKYGRAGLNLLFKDSSIVPDGTLTLDNIPMMYGVLRVGGTAVLESFSNLSVIRARNIRVNGGYAGSGASRLIIQSNTLTIEPVSAASDSVSFSGLLWGQGYDFRLDLKNIGGPAVVSNIYFDALNIGQGTFGGSMRFYNNERNELLLDASVRGYRSALIKDRYVWSLFADALIRFRGSTLYFDRLFFPFQELQIKGFLDFFATNRINTYIRMGGNGTLFSRYSFPVSGNITMYGDEKRAVSRFLVDDRISVSIEAPPDQVSFELRSPGYYPLSRMGLPGFIKGRFSMGIRGWKLSGIVCDAFYRLEDREFHLDMKAERAPDRTLTMSRFLLDSGEDRLLGAGKMWHGGDRLFASVSFIRGGSIQVSSSFNDINAQIDLRNVFIKNFLKPRNNVYVNLRGTFFGPLVWPNYNLSGRMLNAAGSDYFSVELASLSRKWDEYRLRGFRINTPDYQANVDAELELLPGGFTLRSQGRGEYGGLAAASYSIYYEDQGKNRELIYSLNDIRLGRNSLDDISGQAVYQNGRYQLQRNSTYGLSGFWDELPGGRMNWNIEYIWKDLKGGFSGNIEKERISADLLLSSRLELLGLNELIRDFSGSVRLELKLDGNLSSPVLAGSARLYNLSMSLPGVRTRIEGANWIIPLENSKLIFNRLDIPTTTGRFMLNGYIDLRDFQLGYMDLGITPAGKEPAAISLNIDQPTFKVIGDVLVTRFTARGNPSTLVLGGDFTVENNFILFTVDLFGGQKPVALPSWVFNINCTIGNNVKFSNEYMDAFLNKGSLLNIGGSLAAGTFSLKGDILLSRGTISFLGKDFTIRQGAARFEGRAGDANPYIMLEATTRYRDENNDNVEVFLNLEGKLPNLVLKNYYSVPDKPKSELYALLGIQVAATNATSTNQPGQSLLSTAVNTAENIFIFNPASLWFRKNLGVDQFLIRSRAIGNITGWLQGNTLTNALNIFEGTSVVLGKYIVPDLFWQTEFTLSPYQGTLLPLPSMGIMWDLRGLNLEFRYQPFSSIGQDISVIHNIELNMEMRRRF